MAKNNDLVEITKRVWIPINKEKVDPNFIPKDIPFEDNKKVLEQVAIAITKDMPVLLIGETGTGKTSLVRHLAAVTKNGFVRVNHNGGSTVEDIVGRWIINSTGETQWVDGLLVKAMKEGLWFLADEFNAAGAEINFVYHSLLDDDHRIILAEKGSEVVIPHSNFRFFAGMNPPAEYAGTKEVNKALLSRFIVVKTDFPAPEIEAKILVDRTGIPQAAAEKMVDVAGTIRITQAKGEVQYVFSTRDLLMWATMYKVYRKFMLAAEMTVLNKIGSEDIDVIRDVMAAQLKHLDESGVKKKTVKPEAVEDII